MPRKYDSSGRDQFNIEQVQGNVLIQNQLVRHRNELLLLQAVEQEVESRLAQSLHNYVFVTLDKESRPDQVKRLWDTEIKIGVKPAEHIPSETSIITIFEHPEIVGRLLILGDPGSGKTTTMLDLAKRLVDKAVNEANEPIPVLVNLSSWSDSRQSMQDWLVNELNTKYGVRKDIGQKWLEEKLLLPLLDGLDEVKPQLQEPCVIALNLWMFADLRPISIVVCSRKEEYINYQTKLNLNGAIILQSLTKEQIQVYLSNVNRNELWNLLEQDKELLEVVKKPLLLSITILSYQELSFYQWQELKSTKERIKLLLDAYIRAMFERKLKSIAYRKTKTPSARQTQKWLTILALQMQKELQTEFLIEKMQPSYLGKGLQRLIYAINCSLSFGFIGGIGSGVFGGLTFGTQGLLIGSITGIGGGLTFGLFNQKINIVERLRWSWDKVLGGSIYGLSVGLLAGFIIGLIFSNIFEGMIFGFLGGLAGGIPVILHGIEVETRIIPNQGIWQSAKSSILFSLIGAIGIAIAYALTNRNILLGLLAGMPFGLLKGSVACIQHFNLRNVLWLSGFSPHNYSRFLNYCTERLFLQRIGGRYRFIHRLLQEHFAEMEI